MPLDTNTESSQAPDVAPLPEVVERIVNCNCHVFAEHDLFYIVWLVAAFISTIALINNNIPSEYSAMINFIISGPSLHFLAEIIGERLMSFVAIIGATAMALFDIYVGGNIAVFISCSTVTLLSVFVFSLVALRTVKPARKSLSGSKLFVTTSMILKSLLDNGIVPANNYSPTIVYDLRRALFAESFILSIMALWLHASGIPILNPFRRASFSLAPQNRPSIVASVLYWTGAALVVANVILTIATSPAETAIILQVACAVFAICTIAIFFKEPVELKDD